MRRENKYKNQQTNKPNPDKQQEKIRQERIKQDKVKDKLYNIVSNIFKHIDSFYIYENEVRFYTISSQITFDQLQKLSVALNTTEINMDEPEFEEGCSTCGYGAECRRPIFCKNIPSYMFGE